MSSSYPVDGLEELDVHGVSGELALDLDEGVTGGHGLHQQAVGGQSQGVGGALLELALPSLAHTGQVQVTLGQGPGLLTSSLSRALQSSVGDIFGSKSGRLDLPCDKACET